MSDVDLVIETFDEFIDIYKRKYQRRKKRIKQTSYEGIIKSKKTTPETKLLYILIRDIEMGHLAESASKVALLYNSKIMAITTKILENSLKLLENQFNMLEAQITNSKILEKSKDIDDIKKLKSILKAQKEEREKTLKEAHKILETSRKKDLWYVE